MEQASGEAAMQLVAGATSGTYQQQAFAPSFLNLPPEVRNMIYTELFVRAEPIKFDFRKKRYFTRRIQFDFIETAVTARIAGIHLLQTSRQINTEAVAFLYAQNTFLLEQGVYNNLNTVETVCEWLSGTELLPRKLKPRCLVNKLIIELPQSSRDGFGTFYALPMLRHIWSKNHSNLEVVFTESKPTGSSAASTSMHRNMVDFEFLTTMFRLVAVRAHPHWRTYSRLAHEYGCLRRVQFSTSYKHVAFHFHTTSEDRYRADDIVYKYDLGDMRDITYIREARLTNNMLEEIMMLPQVSQLLMDILAPRQHGVTYDLEAKTISKRPPPITAVNRSLREYTMQNWSNCPSQVNMTCQDLRATFGSYRILGHWLNAQTRDDYEKLLYESLEVVLQIAPPTPFKAGNVRFSALDLLWSLTNDSLPYFTTVSVLVHEHRSKSRNIERIREDVKLFLTQILDSFADRPEVFRASISIWFDQQCEPREAELGVESKTITVIYKRRRMDVGQSLKERRRIEGKWSKIKRAGVDVVLGARNPQTLFE